MARKTKRIRIHTYVHTTMGGLNDSLIPHQTTFMFVCRQGVWSLAHTFGCMPDNIVRDFVRGWLKCSKADETVAVRLEKHIFGGAQ